LAKAELGVWELYLERSALSAEEKRGFSRLFREEKRKAQAFLRAIGPERSRPWLFESIHLRSPMIHPLNLLQLAALRRNEWELLRITVTGIASGMVSTG
jgi:phosphoenolpyruvate carboxylase